MFLAFRRALGVITQAGVLVFVCAVLVPVSASGVVLASFLFLPLPATLPEPREPEGGRSSIVYDQNGEEIGEFRQYEQRLPVRQEDIPDVLKHAVISAEDKNFYRHGGVDIRGSLRALVADIRGLELAQGGSTITQQYVKKAYVGEERTIIRKLREAVVASQLDRAYDKEVILYNYLSTIFFGEGAYGVGAASETYFRKPIRDLSVSEAALLAGLIPAPSLYEPRGNQELAEQKRQIVLKKMLEQGYIDQATYDDVVQWKVTMIQEGQPLPDTPHTAVYTPRRTEAKYPYYLDYVRKYLVGKYGEDLVYRGGLRIQTALDPADQEAAQRVVADAVSGTKTATIKRGPRAGEQTPFEMGLASVEPPTGFVKALVGGRDFYAPGGQVNLALGGCYRPSNADLRIEVEAACWGNDGYPRSGGTGRQPGSSFKPFVLATAFAKGVQPTKVYPAPNAYRIPGCTGDRCTIGNYEGSSYGSANLRTATVKSINTVYAQLIRDVGCKDTGEMAKKLGVTSAWYSPDFHTCSGAYSLGTIDVGPLEMASAYATFANRGVYLEPTPVVRVEAPDGTVLEDNRERDGSRVIDEVVADNVTDVMRGVLRPGGTAARASIGRPAAGKTGTSQANQNAWFVGYTPTLSTAIWVGYRDEPISMYGIKGCRAMTGGCLPARTWNSYMSEALKDVPATEFNEPAPIKVIVDRLNRQARTGIDPGARRRTSGTPLGGPYIVGPADPKATPPPTTTTTTSPPPTSTTTTSTTEPRGGGGIIPG